MGVFTNSRYVKQLPSHCVGDVAGTVGRHHGDGDLAGVVARRYGVGGHGRHLGDPGAGSRRQSRGPSTNFAPALQTSSRPAAGAPRSTSR